jgi:putative flavoprotein involved in K+ transport
VPGLYFLGLEFQFALASASLFGMARDAAYIIRHLDRTADERLTRAPSAVEAAA